VASKSKLSDPRRFLTPIFRAGQEVRRNSVGLMSRTSVAQACQPSACLQTLKGVGRCQIRQPYDCTSTLLATITTITTVRTTTGRFCRGCEGITHHADELPLARPLVLAQRRVRWPANRSGRRGTIWLRVSCGHRARPGTAENLPAVTRGTGADQCRIRPRHAPTRPYPRPRFFSHLRPLMLKSTRSSADMSFKPAALTSRMKSPSTPWIRNRTSCSRDRLP